MHGAHVVGLDVFVALGFFVMLVALLNDLLLIQVGERALVVAVLFHFASMRCFTVL